MLARFPGSGNGRSLLFNGHIDVVTAEPYDQWTSDPFRADARGGKLYGRGACDMKGGIAPMVSAAEILASLGHRLAGDLLICTVTDEESTGAGGLAAVAHGVRADAGIVPERTDFEVEIASRGSLIPMVTVAGRPGHAGIPQPHWRQGGAVNAINKASVVMDAMRRLEADWRLRTHEHHPYLSPSNIEVVKIAGGEWVLSIPSLCRVTYHIAYQRAQAAVDGWGGRVRAEVCDWIRRACAADEWPGTTPPAIAWALEVPATEVAEGEPIVLIMLGSTLAVGQSTRACYALWAWGGVPSEAWTRHLARPMRPTFPRRNGPFSRPTSR